MPKNFVAEPFCAVFQKVSGRENFLWIRGGGVPHDFPSKSFCLTVPKRKVLKRNASVFQKVSGVEKFYAQEGNITTFDRQFGVS